MSEQNKIVLDAKLSASLRGKLLDSEYRAVLFERGGKPDKILGIEQKIRDEWRLTPGQWHLETLLEREEPHDGALIDWGQQWEIASGMTAAIREAAQHCGLELEGEENLPGPR